MTTATASRTGSNYTCAHLIVDCLLRHGVREVFGQSLPSALHLAARRMGIRQVAYRTENAGAVMADGFARVSGRIGVVTAQNGPAATLLVAGLAEAFKASVPVLALVQEVSRRDVDRNAFQEFDHGELFRSCAKWVRRIDRADRVEDYIDMAITVATTGRCGPAVLLLPSDLLIESVAPAVSRKAVLGHFPLDRTCPAEADVEAAAAILAAAERPLLIAGGGVHLSGASAALAALQDAASLPVATTVMGKGAVSETHPLALGVVGYFMGRNAATRHMRPMIDGADVVLLVGTRTNQNGTDSWTLLPEGAQILHIDADGAEIGRNYEAHRLCGDARLTLEALTAAIGRQDLSRRTAARPAIEAALTDAREAHAREAHAVLASAAVPMRPERIMAEIDRRLGPDGIVVGDASYSSIWVTNFICARRAGMRFVTPRGLAGIGWGLPLAIGAKTARPEAPVVCIAGDGGFAHVWAELETARRMDVELTMILLNNGVLGYQKHAETYRFGEYTDACDFTEVDHSAVARACGWDAERVETPEQLCAVLDRGIGRGRLFIEAMVDPDAYPPITFMDTLQL